jgi:hypothetical protein
MSDIQLTEATIIETRDNIIRSASSGQYQDADNYLDSYASRLAQEARADERLKDSTIVDEFLKLYYPEQRKRFGITLCAAILQGTEPANEWDRLTKKEMWDTIQEIRKLVGSDGTKSIISDIEDYAESLATKAEPAKVSEDVGRRKSI